MPGGGGTDDHVVGIMVASDVRVECVLPYCAKIAYQVQGRQKWCARLEVNGIYLAESVGRYTLMTPLAVCRVVVMKRGRSRTKANGR